MKMHGKEILCKAGAFALILAMAVSMAGCGKNRKESDEKEAVQLGTNGYVYEPEFLELQTGEEEYWSNIIMQGSKMYYTCMSWDEETGEGTISFYCMDLSGSREKKQLPIQIDEQMNLTAFTVDEQENVVLFLSDYSKQKQSAEGYTIADYYLKKFDAQGTEVFSVDVSDENEDDLYVSQLVLDKDGNIYAAYDQNIFLFQADGTPRGKVESNNWISNMACGRDGKVYFSQWGDDGSTQLVEIDFANAKTGAVYGNVPDSNNDGLCKGTEKDFLISDGNKVYAYDLASQTAEEVLDWLDSDINGQYVEEFSVTKDGKIAVMISDWTRADREKELALLTKTEVSNVKQKELITLGTLSIDQKLQAAAVNFNKKNDTYRVKLTFYINQNAAWTETTYSDAIKVMNNDMISGSGPDLYNLSNINIQNMVKKGVLEDLTPYLEASQNLKKEDFLEAILENYTYDGVLASIPTSFQVQTVLGRTSQVGEEMGWSLEEMMDFIDEHPESSAFEYATKDTMLSYCLMFNYDTFVNEEQGTCNFMSEEFKKVLEYADKFPAEYQYEEDGPSLPTRLRNGEVLLNTAYISDVEGFYMDLKLFGDDEPVTCIGYPTLDGSVGSQLYAGSIYGISSKSSHKEGAWEFFESLFEDKDGSDYFSNGFSPKKSELEKTFEKAMTPEYMMDENGQIMKDENGQPIEQSKGTWGYEDFSIEIMSCTHEQVDQLKAVINTAKPVNYGDSQLNTIITEEVAPYFQGQKSVEAVMDAIQSRASMYISENS